MEFAKYILFKDHDAIDVHNMKFGMERLVFDLGRIIQGSNLEFLDLPLTVGLAPTVVIRLLQGLLLEVGNLPRTVGLTLPSSFPFLESINLGSSNCVIRVLRPLFSQSSNYQSRKNFSISSLGLSSLDPHRFLIGVLSLKSSIEVLKKKEVILGKE
ncbi:hypothetical protein M9H77_30235 [Catharanthus roseus]|uniref:Uncharacterized protein n=1 Tax=Catharanthus roseus TaxID=4058 RepID=A0ACC0A0X7_CATRO|nr:hypothetical protein M9H77_30235 [Catharanthus roseus]